MLPPMTLSSMFWMLLSCLMFLSQVKGEDSHKEQLSTRISCPRGSKAYHSSCYALFLMPKTWTEAYIACQKRSSGHLVSVLNANEGLFVASLVKTVSSAYAYVWIGLHDPTLGLQPNAGGWEWINGDVLNYLSWERHPSTISKPGHCGTLSRSTGFLKWKDYNCEQRLPYVCKFKN
ncbi:PREDICTED: regenerating islet-derived protein 3-alpha isoform X1 [Chrysochloris asiatica]|uniref:Regenerating islet-derived protein 3-alpha isoform X1 n=1 Tax=Chrysochloris asiatica TaxID=185453 RepID=A0A9B0WZM4_CHRAS|nr:PREDICTED: regenerating islet-derived protein 3-alpha isoform X1 [Chrysochloris asiatica]